MAPRENQDQPVKDEEINKRGNLTQVPSKNKEKIKQEKEPERQDVERQKKKGLEEEFEIQKPPLETYEEELEREREISHDLPETKPKRHIPL